MKTLQATSSTIINTEVTTVVTLDKETCVALIRDLSESLGHVGTGRLVLRTNENTFMIFKVSP